MVELTTFVSLLLCLEQQPAPEPTPATAPAPTPAPAPKPSTGALGVVDGGASGGKVLPKEEVSEDVRAFLKVRSRVSL